MKRPRLCLAVLLVPLLGGCSANSPPLFDRIAGPSRVSGDENEVRVQGSGLDALPLAVAHCSKYGKSAQFSRHDGADTIYACVKNP